MGYHVATSAIACPEGMERTLDDQEEDFVMSCLEGMEEDASMCSQSNADLLLSCTTFNVLAPIYKRLGGEEIRESDFRGKWLPRNKKILETLLSKKSSIICLQELWLSNPELVAMYQEAFGREGYKLFKLPRTNDRGDGLLTAVRMDKLEVVHHEDLLFNDCGDRVAQFLWLRSWPRICGSGEGRLEMLVVNTHLLFPHDSMSSFIRLRQVYKLLEHIDAYKARHGLGPMPILLCGDLNGTKQGQVSKFLRSQGFASSYDIAHNYPDSDERWVSHRNHHGVVCGVDFIWLLNPSEQRSPLSADWKAAVFRFLRAKLSQIGYHDARQAFSFFCSASDAEDEWSDEEELEKDRPYAGPLRPGLEALECELEIEEADGELCGEDKAVITMTDFESAVSQLGHEMGLTRLEVKELMASADTDGNGVVDYDDFQAFVDKIASAPVAEDKGKYSSIISSSVSPCSGSDSATSAGDEWQGRSAVRFEVQDASLFPPETEDGVWPHDYVMSDHAVLTAVFSPKCINPSSGFSNDDDDDLCLAPP